MNPRSNLRVVLLGAVLLCALFGLVDAASAQAPTLVQIRVVGAQSVQPQQVVAWSGLEVGQAVTRETVAQCIRKLFDTGKFSDVFVYELPSEGGLELIVNLVEYPRLSGVRFEGLDKIKQEDLEEELKLRVGDFITPAQVRRSHEKIRAKYRSEGYYNAKVTSDSTAFQAGGRQVLLFRVVEGKKVKVQSIAFEGNEHLDYDTLRGAMKTKTDGLIRSGTFKLPEFEADLEAILALYRDEGYLDAQVLRHELNFREDRNKIDLVIHLEEGEQYTVGDIDWSGNTVYPDERIQRLIRLEKGEIFRESLYQESLQSLHSLYWEDGYIYIVVSPQRDIRDRVVDVSYSIREGTQAKVRRVEIAGNTKTHENVIRREMRILPGDLFVNSDLRDSQRDIFQLGYFNDVKVDFRQTSRPEDIDLVFEVEERQTGQFTMGVGFSQETRASGFLNVGENNLFGRAQSLQFSWQFGNRRNFLDLSFTEPWFLGTPTLIGMDVFNRFTNRVSDFYDTRVKGFAVRLGRPLPGTRYSRASIRYGFSQTSLSNFDPFYVETLDQLERELGASGLEFQRLDQTDWPQNKSGVTLALSRNSTDSPFFPTRGSRSSVRYEVNGGILGGDLSYQKTDADYDWYQPLPWKFAFHLGASTGHLGAFGDTEEVPDYERFRLGGNRIYPLRGYDDLSVVPRGNPSFVGGRFYTTLTSEILYPISRAVHVLGFVDQGDTWNSFSEADLTNLRTGAGLGIRLEVPMVGNIGLDYGYGFDKADPGWQAHFNFGRIF